MGTYEVRMSAKFELENCACVGCGRGVYEHRLFIMGARLALRLGLFPENFSYAHVQIYCSLGQQFFAFKLKYDHIIWFHPHWLSESEVARQLKRIIKLDGQMTSLRKWWMIWSTKFTTCKNPYPDYFLWLWPLVLWPITEVLVLLSIPYGIGTHLSI